MIDLTKLEDSKISIELSGYPVVFLGETGDGKTGSLNIYLRQIAPEGKVPLFIELEDRYKTVPNLRAIRCYNESDVLDVINALKNPQVRKLFSGVVFDTADKLEELFSTNIANKKEVSIIEDIGFSKGRKYLSADLEIVNTIRNMGLPVHFTAQLYEKVDIKKNITRYQTKLNEVTKAKMFHDAFLVGCVKLDRKAKDPLYSDRIISFNKCETYPDLKDTFGLPKEMHIMEIKDNIEKVFNKKYDKSQLTNEEVLQEVVETETLQSVIAKCVELANKLANGGKVNEAMYLMKTELGCNDDGSPKMFNSLTEAQLDIGKVLIIKLQELCDKFNLK